jgi:hypothetical protein
MTWARNVACIREKSIQGFDGKMISKWIVEKQDERLWTALFWVRIGTSGIQPRRLE